MKTPGLVAPVANASPLETTREFGKQKIEFDVDAPNWRWARLAVWDIAGNGAFANPVRNSKPLRTVAVDNWHNREPQPHYAWEGTYQGGFSGLGEMLRGLGAATKTISEPLTQRSLQGTDLLIVVDPDTPQESNPERTREKGEVYGYQCEIAANGTAGKFWDEGRRTKWLDGAPEQLDDHPYKPGEWNEYVVTLRGPHVTIELNGETIRKVNLDEETIPVTRHDGSPTPPLKERPRKGRIGFQELSRGGGRVMIRNARIKEL